MTDQATLTPNGASASDTKPAKNYTRLKQIVFGLVGLTLGGIAILRFATSGDLPGCASNDTRDVLRNIFKSKDVAVSAFNDATTLTKTDDLITCASSVVLSDGTLLFDYKIFPSETKGNFRVEITSARPK